MCNLVWAVCYKYCPGLNYVSTIIDLSHPQKWVIYFKLVIQGNLRVLPCLFLLRAECAFGQQSFPNRFAQTNSESNGLHLSGSQPSFSSIQCLLAPAYEPSACQPSFVTHPPHPAGSGPAKEPPRAPVALLGQRWWIAGCTEQSEPFLMRTNETGANILERH